MDFEFSEYKDRKNRREHGISLCRARNFDLLSALVVVDDSQDYGEVRYIATGFLDHVSMSWSSLSWTTGRSALSACARLYPQKKLRMPNTRKNPKDPDSPFITPEGMRKAVPFNALFPNMDTSDITVVEVDEERGTRRVVSQTKSVELRLSHDVVAALQAKGSDWNTVAEDLLRAGLELPRSEKSRAIKVQKSAA